MQRQQQFLASVIVEATGSGLLASPVKLGEVADAVLGSVRADQNLGPGDLIALARSLRGLKPGSSEFTTVPVGQMSYMIKDVGSTLKWDDAKAKKLWTAIREDRPLAAAGHPTKRVEVAPSSVRVRVENGTSIPGLGAKADKALRAVGFDTTGAPANATGHTARTVVAYDPRWDRSAHALAAALPGAELTPVPGQGAVMRVTVGADYRRVSPVTAESKPSEDAAPVNGDHLVCR
jgi:hypothetical protein